MKVQPETFEYKVRKKMEFQKKSGALQKINPIFLQVKSKR